MIICLLQCVSNTAPDTKCSIEYNYLCHNLAVILRKIYIFLLAVPILFVLIILRHTSIVFHQSYIGNIYQPYKEIWIHYFIIKLANMTTKRKYLIPLRIQTVFYASTTKINNVRTKTRLCITVRKVKTSFVRKPFASNVFGNKKNIYIYAK